MSSSDEIPPEVEEILRKAFEEEFLKAFWKVLDEQLTSIAAAMPRIEGQLWAEAERLKPTGGEYVVRNPK